MNKSLKKTYPLYFTFLAFGIYGLFYLVPTLSNFFYAFTDYNALKPEISFVGLENFKYLFIDSYFKLALKNTIVYAVFTTLLKVGVGLALAVVLNRKMRLTPYLRAVFFLPYILSYVVVGIIFHALFQYDGIINQFIQMIGFKNFAWDWLGSTKTAFGCAIVMDVWKASGFFMVIFLAGLQSIPQEYYEAAAIDGASKRKQFRYITMPLLVSSFTINITLAMIGGLRVFDPVYVLTKGGPANSSNVLNTIVYQAQAAGMYGRGTAMGLTLTLTILLLSLIVTSVLGKKEVQM